MSDTSIPDQNPSVPQSAGPSQPAQQPAFRPSQMNAQPMGVPAAQPVQPAQAAPQTAYRQAPAAQQVAQQQQTYANPSYRPASMQPAHSAPTAASQAGGWVKSLVAGVVGALLATIITLAVSSFGGSAVPSDDTANPVANGGSGGNTTISVTGGDVTLPEVVAAKTLPALASI